MDSFERFFGIKRSVVKPTCILLPLARKEAVRALGIDRFSKGALYSAAAAASATVIRTNIGAPFLGDAVLHLAGSACRNVILLGSCGSAGGEHAPAIGEIVCPLKCYAAESFSRLLVTPRAPLEVFYASLDLRTRFMKAPQARSVRDATCLSAGSLKLQEVYLPLFKAKGVDVFDMECASLFASSRHSRMRALALLYVTDIVREKPFHRVLDGAEEKIISGSARRAATIISEFAGLL